MIGGVPVLVAFRRSGATNWTTVGRGAARRSQCADDCCLVADGRARRPSSCSPGVLPPGSRPARSSSRSGSCPIWSPARRTQVSELSGQLLALQEEERQRIARELHDSTAQHLVAANLGLARLEASGLADPGRPQGLGGDRGPARRGAAGNCASSPICCIPPNLANDGLQATLRDFAEGFAGRTGLVARIRIPEEVDDLPPELQRAILRVVQEALTNVHRHADASHVSVDARIMSERLVVRIRDNGHGMTGAARPGRTDPARRRRCRACAPAWSSSAAA